MQLKRRMFVIVIMILCAAGCRSLPPPSRADAQEDGVRPPDLSTLIEMKVVSVHSDPRSQGYLVALETVGDETPSRVVPIIVGQREADVLQMKLARQLFVRPLTHDLALSLVSVLGGKVQHVVVEDLRNGIFLARIYVIDKDGTLRSVDSRASDALIIALSTGIKIHFARKVVDATGMAPDEDEAPEEEEEEQPIPSALSV